MKKKTKNTAARSPATLSVSRYCAVKAHRQMTDAVQPILPMSKKVLRPKRSTKKAVQTLPIIVKLVQQALSKRGTNPVSPSDAYIRTP